jgi:hypothetical protein
LPFLISGPPLLQTDRETKETFNIGILTKADKIEKRSEKPAIRGTNYG